MQSRTKLVSLISTAAMMLAVASASAGTISTATFTTDAYSGISPSKTYTHLFDMGNGDVAVVNDVTFNAFSNPGSGYDTTITHGNLTLTTVPMGSYGFNDNTNTMAIGVDSSQGMYNLLYDYIYGHDKHEYSTAELSGLTPGAEYDLRIYYRNAYQPQLERLVKIIFDYGGANDEITVDEHSPDSEPYYASYLSYQYIAPSSGKLLVMFDHLTADNMAWVWHGMSNELVAEVPELSTLALLACGLLGLLAYAWRKRK
ncbi:MAG: hypothetical protein GX594_12315 [Pirellulaceae bacterium]|nr:hypothetical protein [Pirellulaceae bacterium]